MGNKFSDLEKNDSNMSPVHKQDKKSDEVDSMSSATLRKELRKRGVAADEVLREKLRELRESETPRADTDDNKQFSRMVVDAPDEAPTELPVPIVKQPETSRTTRSGTAGTPPRHSAPRRGRPPAGSKPMTTRSGGYHRKRGVKKTRWTSGKRKAVRKAKATKPIKKEESDDSEYDVEKLLDVQNKTSGREFLVRWTGYSKDHDEWIPESNFSQPFVQYKMADALKTKLGTELESAN